LAATDAYGTAVNVLLGNGDGTFKTARAFPTGNYPNSVAVGDINGDGKPDLVVTSSFDNTASVFLGNGDGTFRPRVDNVTGNFPEYATLGDFNSDGRPDLAVGNGYSATVSVFLNATGTRMTLTSEPNPSDLGDAVTFTAKVAASVKGAGMPKGTVTFQTDHDKVTVKLVDGVATYTTSKLTVGKHHVIAHYDGDSQFAPRDSRPITQRVLP
jgi:hypothetical protein